MAKDYYKILGVSKTASPDEIKKAFRKLAHQHHPDKQGGDSSKFKEASEAYAVLSDEKKRANYDQFGTADAGGGFQGGQGFGGFDFSGFQGGFGGEEGYDLGDLFGGIFGGGGRGRGHARKGADIAVDVEISFKDSVYGVDRKILLHKNSACSKCKGGGNEPGTDMKTCDNCKGKGQIKDVRQSIFGSIAVNRQCEICLGAGKIPKEKCHQCKGSGIENKKEEINVRIPSGVESGEAVRLTGGGEAITGGPAGDLFIRIHVTKNSNFKKEGSNITGELKIKISDALLGADKQIDTVDGPLTVPVPAGIQHGEILRIKNRGFVLGNGPKRGDLMLKIFIEIPHKLSKGAKILIEDLRKEGL
ncbi:MAG: molecular chaperone DnaJ [bacterium]